MDIIFLIIPLSVVLVFVIGAFFWWFLKSGQFEDMEGPAYRIVMDDDRPPEGMNRTATDESNVKNATKV